MSPPPLLLVLAKAPVPGMVKTRLCPPATPQQAARIAAAALLDTLDAVRAVPGACPVLALSGDLGDAERAEEITRSLAGIPVLPQRGSSLGQRIAAAHADAATLSEGSPILQIGMDTPQIHSGLLTHCAESLTRPGIDAVLGPATDGGWWLLGLRDPLAANSISSVATSRPDTGERTAQALRRNGFRVGTLPSLSDVDTAADAVRVALTVPGGRFAAAVRDAALTVDTGTHPDRSARLREAVGDATVH